MALGSDEATFNAAVDTLIDAWITYVNTLSSNEQVRVVWGYTDKGSTTGEGHMGSATSLKNAFNMGPQFYFKNNPDTLSNAPNSVAGRPLFFKITNAAGDLS